MIAINDKSIVIKLLNKLEQIVSEEVLPVASVFYVRTCGKVIKMVYQEKNAAELAKEGFRKYLVPEGTDYSATFIHMRSELRSELPLNSSFNFYDSHVRLKVIYDYLLSCADFQHRVYYYCTATRLPFCLDAHAMVVPYYLWGLQNDLLLTHSAAIGCGNKGVLLVANGGGGKSTLAAGCLMHGLDFISDDTTMLTTTGQLTAFPIYSDIGLTPKSCEMLNPPYPVHWINELHEDKRFMDITEEKNFKDSIGIHALVAPKITLGETKIYEIDAERLVFRFYLSSLIASNAMGNQEYMADFIGRLKHLKAYQLELGRDVHYNVEFFRDFINKAD